MINNVNKTEVATVQHGNHRAFPAALCYHCPFPFLLLLELDNRVLMSERVDMNIVVKIDVYLYSVRFSSTILDF